MDRRRFLKYTGASAAVVGASALGLGYLSGQNLSTASSKTSTATMHQLATSSSVASTSTQTTQLTSLRGRLFFDYNGNGKQDGEEPAVAGARVQLKDSSDNVVVAETVTDSSGEYKLEHLKIGGYLLHVVTDKRFTHLCISPSGFRSVSDDLVVSLMGESECMDIGLMEGFLTLPLSSKTNFSIDRFYDWDPDPKRSLWWNNSAGSDPYNHPGIDYRIREGVDVIATAPGIFEANNTGRDAAGALYVYLSHPSANVWTFYNHLSEVLVTPGAVKRGDVIAKTGSSGAAYPHLHFGLCRYIGDYLVWSEAYKTLFEIDDANSGYWAQKEHDTYHWIKVPKDANPNVHNNWTRLNDPQFPS